MSFELTDRNGILLLRMSGPKANSMSEEWLLGLRDALAAARDAEPAGLVITGAGKVFSAGMALPDLIDLDRDQMRTFMQGFAATMEQVLTFPRPVVAAVNGHAVAGGCVLSLMCDYTVMASGGPVIGLKEVALGIGLPAIVLEVLRARVPARSVAPIAMSAQLFDSEEALALELVGDVVPPEELVESAHERALALSGPPQAIAQVKQAVLRPLLAELRSNEDAELEAWLDTWFSPDGRRLVGDAVAALRR